jgi:hypothetical protein
LQALKFAAKFSISVKQGIVAAQSGTTAGSPGGGLAQFDFLCELCGCSLRALRFKLLHLAANQDPCAARRKSPKLRRRIRAADLKRCYVWLHHS